MKQQVIYILTHDSIGLGEDGPTHQPIEHLAMLRGIPNLNVFRTGSEISVAIEAHEKLKSKGIESRVVSVPCFDIFAKQSEAYKNKILGDKNILKLAIEAGISQGWHQIIGSDGIFIGMNDFGASGQACDLFKHFKITAENACDQILNRLKNS